MLNVFKYSIHPTMLKNDVLVYSSDDKGFAWVRRAGELPQDDSDGRESTLGYFPTLVHALGEARKRGFNNVDYWVSPEVGIPLSCQALRTPYDLPELTVFEGGQAIWSGPLPDLVKSNEDLSLEEKAKICILAVNQTLALASGMTVRRYK